MLALYRESPCQKSYEFAHWGKIYRINIDLLFFVLCFLIEAGALALAIWLCVRTHGEYYKIQTWIVSGMLLLLPLIWPFFRWFAYIVYYAILYAAYSVLCSFREIRGLVKTEHADIETSESTPQALELTSNDAACQTPHEEEVFSDERGKGHLFSETGNDLSPEFRVDSLNDWEKATYIQLCNDAGSFLPLSTVQYMHRCCLEVLKSENANKYAETVRPLSNELRIYCFNDHRRVKKYDLYTLAFNIRELMFGGEHVHELWLLFCRFFPNIMTMSFNTFYTSVSQEYLIDYKIVHRWYESYPVDSRDSHNPQTHLDSLIVISSSKEGA